MEDVSPYNTAEESDIRDVDIRCHWNGSQNEAVMVDLYIRIHARPGSTCVVFETSNELVKEARISNVQKCEPIVYSKETESPRQPSAEMFGNRSSALCADLSDQVHQPTTIDWYQLARLYQDLTSSRRFCALSAQQRWEQIKDEASFFEASTTGSDSEHQVDLELDCDRTLSNTFNEGTGCSSPISAVPRDVSQPSNSSEENSQTLGLRVFKLRGKRFEVPLAISSIFESHDAPFSSSPKRTHQRQFADTMEANIVRCKRQKSSSVSNKSVRNNGRINEKRASSNSFVKTPWQSSSQEDFSKRWNINLKAKSSRSPNTGRPSVRHADAHFENVMGNRGQPTSESIDYYQQSTPSPTERRNTVHDSSAIIKGTGEIANTITSGGTGRGLGQIKSLNISAQRSFMIYEDENMGSSSTSAKDYHGSVEANRQNEEGDEGVGASHTQHNTQDSSATLDSPPISPRLWLRYGGASAQYHRDSSLFPFDSMPTWEDKDGKLFIHFADNSLAGTYEVYIQARIQLGCADTLKHYSFTVPGLSLVQPNGHSSRTGGFAFYLESSHPQPNPLEVRFNADSLLDYRIKDSNYVIGRFRLDMPPKLNMRIKELRAIPSFTTSLLTEANVEYSVEKGIETNYHVTMTFDTDEDIFAHQVEIAVVIRHGHQQIAPLTLAAGNCEVRFEYDPYRSGNRRKACDSLVTITRDVDDMYRMLHFYFVVPQQIGYVTLPTLRPLTGKVLSETIIVTKPKQPLGLNEVRKSSYTSWTTLNYVEDDKDMIRFDRVELSRHCPEHLRDDPVVCMTELSRVRFAGSGTVESDLIIDSSALVARNLSMKISRVLGGGLQCRMEVDVLAGQHAQVLFINPYKWDAVSSLVNNVQATDDRGEWRKIEKGLLALLKTNEMVTGQAIHIVFDFQLGPEVLSICADGLPITYNLPKIESKTVLGAKIEIDMEFCAVHLINGPNLKVCEVLSRKERPQARLPILTDAYQVKIQYQRAFDVPERHMLLNSILATSKTSRRRLARSILTPLNSTSAAGGPVLFENMVADNQALHVVDGKCEIKRLCLGEDLAAADKEDFIDHSKGVRRRAILCLCSFFLSLLYLIYGHMIPYPKIYRNTQVVQTDYTSRCDMSPWTEGHKGGPFMTEVLAPPLRTDSRAVLSSDRCMKSCTVSKSTGGRAFEGEAGQVRSEGHASESPEGSPSVAGSVQSSSGCSDKHVGERSVRDRIDYAMGWKGPV